MHIDEHSHLCIFSVRSGMRAGQQSACLLTFDVFYGMI